MEAEDKGKRLRRSCVESFVGLSAELKAQLYKCVLLISEAYTKIYDPCDVNRVVHDACVRIMQECAQLGPLSGALIDINLFNLFCFFRSTRMRTKCAATFNVPCAEAAQGIIRILTERLLFCMEKTFIAAACSGVSLPPSLCMILYEIYAEMKNKCIGAWRRLACNRKPIMQSADSLLKLYQSHDGAGLISDQMKALFLLVFQPVYLPRIMTPLEIIAKGQAAPENFYSITGSAEKRRPMTTGRVSTLGFPGSNIIPESLILPIMEPGLLPSTMVDLSDVLARPGPILNAPPLSQFVISRPHPSLPHSISVVPFNPSGTDATLLSTWQAASQTTGESPMELNTGGQPTQPASTALRASESSVGATVVVPDVVHGGPVNDADAVAGSNILPPAAVAACFVPAPAMGTSGTPLPLFASGRNSDPNTVTVAQRFQPTPCLTLLQVTCATPTGPMPDTKVRAPVAQVPTVVPLTAEPFLRSIGTSEDTGGRVSNGGQASDEEVRINDAQLTPKRKQKIRERVSKRSRAAPVQATSPGRLDAEVPTTSAAGYTATTPSGEDASPPDVSEQTLFNLLDATGEETWDAGSPSLPADDELLSTILQGLYQLDEPPPVRSPTPEPCASRGSDGTGAPSSERLTTLQPVSAEPPPGGDQDNSALAQLLQWRNYFLD
ncbi:ORF50 [Retroperitoneal fibromatosis-associated herpesvirus]|uniref:ORF50 n=1 Tax=Retroperitoneal fibromatosis-associated herpesvirus TaxID=111469 RepID=U5NIX5_9GAMA|nr:ORF50 [Retroperitoneal fibromatosis-associated herpesvirus]AGY30731.1 ORF50 [Retroperitoneal fibromatosis-associated herpesvirus]